MKKETITTKILGKYGIKNVVNGSFALEAELIDGHLSFASYPAVFLTETDAEYYIEKYGISARSNYIIETLIAVNWDRAILITFNDETETETDGTDDIIAALRTIRTLCEEQESCANCPLRLTPDTCSITQKVPEKWVLVGDDPKEANKLFVN